MIHMLAGNSPAGCVSSIAQGALVKAINVFKMPSSDPFTCVAMLRTMAEIDPDHPVVRSMSAVYWRGGDERIERTLYRPQYFDKIVAWGGGDAINNVIKYLGPGLQLVSFDPKTSISMIGPRASRPTQRSRRSPKPPPPMWPCSIRRPASPAASSSSRGSGTASRSSAPACRSASGSIARPPRGGSAAAARDPRGDRDAAGHGRRLPGYGARRTAAAW